MDPEQTQSNTFLELLAWAEANKKKLLYGFGGLVAIALLVFLFVNYQTQRETRASEALSEIRVPSNPGTPVPPGTADAYYKVAKDHSGTKAAGRALLQSAGLLFAEKNYVEAQKRFEEVIRQYADSQFLPEATLGVASSLDLQGRTADAIVKYEEVRRRFGTAGIGDEAKLALGRLYESSKSEEAFKLYEEVAKANPGNYSGLGTEANLRLEDLLKKNPDLAKLREPVTPVARPVLLTNPPKVITNLSSTNIPVSIKVPAPLSKP